MKILFVEDDPVIAAAVRRGLAGEGFTVDLADNGDDGYWMATEATYDVIVLDVMLPGRDGLDVCRSLRAHGDWTPVVMLTAKVDDTDQIDALAVGADDYVTKPFSFPVLVARLRSVLRRTEQRTTTPSVVGQVRADSVAHRVWVSDTELELTAREFAVLEYLMRRAGQVVSKDELLGGVWEFTFDGDPNIVEVYIARLRRKLRQAGADDVIQTVRGYGYRLQAHQR